MADYIIRDISLADWGKKEIAIAETEMPGLMALRTEFGGDQPLKGARIDYINPHATSTPVGDEKEIEAIREVFGRGEDCPPIAATKSLTGHSLGATGVQEAIYALLMMNNGFICESAHIDEIDPAFADMPILRERRDGELTTVMSNSFGFGGTKGTVVFSKV